MHILFNNYNKILYKIWKVTAFTINKGFWTSEHFISYNLKCLN